MGYSCVDVLTHLDALPSISKWVKLFFGEGGGGELVTLTVSARPVEASSAPL